MEMNKFATVMGEKDDVELIRVVTSARNDYQPEAVIAAEEELKKRNVSASMYQEFTSKVEKLIEAEKNTEKIKRKLPLPGWIKVVAFLFPFLLFIVIGIGLAMFGYQKRGKELCKWTFLGLAFYLMIIMLVRIIFG